MAVRVSFDRYSKPLESSIPSEMRRKSADGSMGRQAKMNVQVCPAQQCNAGEIITIMKEHLGNGRCMYFAQVSE